LYKSLLFAFLLAAAAEPIRESSPLAALWTTPCILLASLFIAWAAESSQFFVAQGFALAILAWLQTLPEFAVEAVLAWHRQVAFLLANLTGALRLLTGLGWPMIYASAAFFNRRATGRPLRRIELHGQHSVQVVGLLLPLLYAAIIWLKASLHLYDAIILIAIYAAYLLLLSKMPPQEAEGIEDLERIPRAIVLSPPARRKALIATLFIAGGGLIYFTATPFLSSLMALAVAAGVPAFVFIQWMAPFVSEFPEMASTFYWARTVTGAPMALMNMVSSNINQWTLLVAMLPIVFSMSNGAVSAIPLDGQQELELLMTIGQALAGMLFLVNMVLTWWEAAVLFALWAIQFAFSAAGSNFAIAGLSIHWLITIVYFVWAAVEILRIVLSQRKPAAFVEFAKMWREYVMPRG
jgi:cation:H+ antiporter